jgi:PAS domain S-box-containing protein
MDRVQTKPQSVLRSLNRDYLALSLVPFIAFLVCTFAGVFLAQRYIGRLIDGSMRKLEAGIEDRTVKDGERLVQSRAREASRQLGLVIEAHSRVTIKDLQRSPVAKSIALQQVGLTGYTCLYEAGTGVMRIHPNPELSDRPMEALAEKLPSWWKIFEPSLAGVEVSGFYDWIEEDGRVTLRYMAMTPVAVPVEGRTLMIAATTYMDEFLSPAQFSRERARQIAGQYRDYVSRQVQLIGAVMLMILAVTLFVVYWLSRRAAVRFALPIRQLAAEAAGFGRDLATPAAASPMTERPDEMGELARAFSRMRSQIADQFRQIKTGYEKLWQAQQALSESEAHYRSLFDHVPIGICRSEPGGRVIDANPAMTEMFGYPDKETLLARPATELYLDPQDREIFKQIASGDGDGRRCEFQMRRRDGSVIWVELQAVAVRNDKGRILYYESSSKDVTERRKAEEELQLARFCIDNAALGIFRVGDDARILDVNEHACRSLGYGRSELLGMTIFDIDPGFSLEKWGAHRQKLAEKGVRIIQSHHRRKDGTMFPIEVTGNYFEKDGKGFSYSFATDISGRLAAERDKEKLASQLQQAQKMEAIGTLAGGIAHDFNNILSVILGNANMLELSESMAKDDLPNVRQILSATERARRLVKQILTFSRRDKQQRLPVSLKPVIQETFDFLKSTLPTSIEVRRVIPADTWSVWADPTQMQQVLMNLCTNAANAMESQENGVLEIRLEKTVIFPEQARFEQDVAPGEFVKLAVTDTGPGIAPGVRERLFEPYFTTKGPGKGTGLGLSLVHGIVSAHGGFIKVRSESGKGASFQVFLPLAPEGAKPAAAAAAGRLPGGSETLLVVDDEKALVDMMRQMLERLGYRVETRTSPIEAVEAFRVNPGRYKAVVTDMNMPQMNGMSLAKKLLEIRADLPILLCTGFSDQTSEDQARAAGIKEFAFKPLAMSDFATTLRKLLDASGAGGTPEPALNLPAASGGVSSTERNGVVF